MSEPYFQPSPTIHTLLIEVQIDQVLHYVALRLLDLEDRHVVQKIADLWNEDVSS